MLQKKYRSTLISINNPFEGIYTLEFRSLNGRYKYHPGQFLHLTIDSDYDDSGQWPDSRCFSMQSNPNEETIKITYSVKGQFTRQMEQQLKIGSEVWLKLPYGNLFTQPHNKENTIFIAGGTGITPFLSLFTHPGFQSYYRPSLFFGLRNKSMNIYNEELKIAKNINPELTIRYVYQDEEGFLNIEQIEEESNHESCFYISGPPIMIKSFKMSLLDAGVNIQQIKTDDWE